MKRGRDMAIFRFSKMAAAVILDLRNFTFSTVERSRGTKCVIMPNFVEIAVTAAEIWCFWIFQDGGRRHLGFLTFRIFNGRTRH